MTQNQAIEFLKKRPVEYARMLGFDKLTDIHNDWIREMVFGRGDNTLQASRNTYKTTCVSVALGLISFLLPRKRTLFLRKTNSDVEEIVAQTQKILEDPHTQYFVNVIYGVNLRLTTKNATEISTNLNADIKGSEQLVGLGIGASITGKHFDFIFTDDIVNIEDRKSRAERERTKLTYQELQNIKNRNGRIFNSGTPWHPDDAFALMPPPEKFDCYHPAISELFASGEIENRKQNMSPSLFAANYELCHVASEKVIFENAQVGGSADMVREGIMQIDAAFYGDDFTAWCCVRKREGKIYVLGKMRRLHVEECYSDIVRDFEMNQIRKTFLENNADKGYVARDLKAAGVRCATYHEGQNKYIKIVTYLKGVWRDIIFVDGTDAEFVQQILDYNEDAEHDDAPDALASAIRRIGSKDDSADYVPLWN